MRKSSKNNSLRPESSDAPQPSTVMSEEAVESFEAELCWCIKQLQRGLQLGKLNAKQVQDHTKALNTLMSKTTPIIKKRQVMRLSFGDYRSKMAEDDKRVNKVNQQVKVTTKPNPKSKFVKKSSSNACSSFSFPIPKFGTESNRGTDSSNITNRMNRLEKSSPNFKFNFDVSR
ncbi:hypothetical protein RN001_015248 [Aquatica leii]|uniref:Uncharacterized protein n=1 Tax=Aquatica leii TaxID=1421715 RepID=A0AAN7NYZ3_9COLE|nr:hypothetical protein RN001_015248 [Aquatica leii]